MTSNGLGELVEGDSADMCAGKFLLVSMGGRAEGIMCADPGARTPIGASGIIKFNACQVEDFPTKDIVISENSEYYFPQSFYFIN